MGPATNDTPSKVPMVLGTIASVVAVGTLVTLCAVTGDDGDEPAPERQAAGRDEATVFERLYRACARGSITRCTEVGVRYEKGRGVARDVQKAADFYGRSCELGDAPGCRRLGILYEGGVGMTADPAKAARSYRRGCAIGDATACSSLAKLLRDGRGVDRDDAAAAKLFKKACDWGDTESCDELGSHDAGGPVDGATDMD